jgi:hypothetical protein
MQSPASVDHDILSRDETRHVRAQNDHDFGNIAGL